jgi:hypothetical protein
MCVHTHTHRNETSMGGTSGKLTRTVLQELLCHRNVKVMIVIKLESHGVTPRRACDRVLWIDRRWHRNAIWMIPEWILTEYKVGEWQRQAWCLFNCHLWKAQNKWTSFHHDLLCICLMSYYQQHIWRPRNEAAWIDPIQISLELLRFPLQPTLLCSSPVV